MKITKSYLKQIIKESLEEMKSAPDYPTHAYGSEPGGEASGSRLKDVAIIEPGTPFVINGQQYKYMTAMAGRNRSPVHLLMNDAGAKIRLTDEDMRKYIEQ